MVSVLSAVGLFVIVAVNTAIAAVMVRFFRLRLDTRWGTAVFTLALVPFVLFASLLVLSGVFRLGGDVGSQSMALVVSILLPLVLGGSIDLLWMPSPDEMDLPDR